VKDASPALTLHCYRDRAPIAPEGNNRLPVSSPQAALQRSDIMGAIRRYGFAWVTGGFFVISLVGHWLFGWFAYVSDQQAHKQPVGNMSSR
jgi:hypothetical protein